MGKMTLTKREPTHVQIANRAFEIYVSREQARDYRIVAASAPGVW